MTDWIAVAKAMCPKAPKGNIETAVPLIEGALRAVAMDDVEIMLVAIATVHVETGVFLPISEYQSQYNTAPGGKPFAKYDGRRDLGNEIEGDGARYKGRGYVQLTGRANYRDIGKRIGADLEAHPELANEFDIAARILAAFMKREEKRLRDAIDNGDLKAARKVVNGGSHGLDEFVAAYRRGEDALA